MKVTRHNKNQQPKFFNFIERTQHQNQFTLVDSFSTNRLLMVATFRVGEWVRTNLPILFYQAQQLADGIQLTMIESYLSQNYYTISIITASNLFNMGKTTIFFVHSTS